MTGKRKLYFWGLHKQISLYHPTFLTVMSTLDFDRDKGRERKTQKIIFVTSTYLSASIKLLNECGKNCYFPELFMVDNGAKFYRKETFYSIGLATGVLPGKRQLQLWNNVKTPTTRGEVKEQKNNWTNILIRLQPSITLCYVMTNPLDV